MNINVNPSTGFPNLYNVLNDSFTSINPFVIIGILVVLVVYYFVFSSLGGITNKSVSNDIMSTLGNNFTSPVAGSPTGSSSMGIMELFFWGLLIFLVLINGLQYFFSLDINTIVKNIFSPTPEVDIVIDHKKDNETTVPEIMFKKQVFHIPDNNYTYNDAKAVCKAYDARLASYDEVESAYNDGAEWCSYGWSKDQLALFPTLKTSYDKLQKIKGHENDCGRPGVNGGFIDNKKVRFGVNCYGYKPKITGEEMQRMSTTKQYPITKKDRELEKLVEKYRKILPNILVSPFNKNRWSQI